MTKNCIINKVDLINISQILNSEKINLLSNADRQILHGGLMVRIWHSQMPIDILKKTGGHISSLKENNFKK